MPFILKSSPLEQVIEKNEIKKLTQVYLGNGLVED